MLSLLESTLLAAKLMIADDVNLLTMVAIKYQSFFFFIFSKFLAWRHCPWVLFKQEGTNPSPADGTVSTQQ